MRVSGLRNMVELSRMLAIVICKMNTIMVPALGRAQAGRIVPTAHRSADHVAEQLFCTFDTLYPMHTVLIPPYIL